MAFTATLAMKTVLGDQRVHGYEVLTDGTSDEIDTGLDYITYMQVGVKSAVTNGTLSFDRNVLTAATVSNGTISITGCTSGDEFFITVYGR